MLKDQAALVTGSTSGIGLGIATALAEAGANVMLNGFGDAAEIERIRADLAKRCGVLGLTKTVALEVAETRITCNAVCPGYVKTPLVEGQIADQAKAHNMSQEQVIREVILASQPNKRFVEVKELSDLVVFLCSPAAASITGIALPVEGGWTAR